MRNGWLIAAGSLSAAASLLHLAMIPGGPAWYRFFGAGERMVRLTQRAPIRATSITIAIAAILAIWAAYAFSGAGLIPRLPLLRAGLVTICAIYFARAAALPVMLRNWPGGTPTFLVVSSIVVLIFAIVHAIGIWKGWAAL